MEEISLDNQLLLQIIECFDESQKTCTDQFVIYTKLQDIVNDVPNFFCYFIHIIVFNIESKSNNIFYSQLSIIFIRRYFKFIKMEEINSFLMQIIPIILNIISNHIIPLISHSTILLADLVKYYGPQAVPNFDDILIMLISNENTIHASLDAMLELSENECQYQLKIEHLHYLITIFSNVPNSHLISTFLLVIINLLRSQISNLYLSFISTEILKFIQINYTKFQSTTLLHSMCIVIPFFESTGNSELGDIIAYCIHTLGGFSFEALDSFSEEVPFHPGLITSLFECLQIEDDENSFNPWLDSSDIAQEILINMITQHEAPVINMIIELISKSSNPTQILKGLYAICLVSDLENVEFFFQFAMQHLHDESRGHAALFLSQIATPENSNQIISELIPLVLDESKDVRDKVFFSLGNLLQPYFELDVEIGWIPPLLQAFMIIVGEDDSVSASPLSQIIFCLLDRFENLNDELFQSFFKFVYDLFFCNDKISFLLPSSILLEVLLKKLKIDFSAEIEVIVHRITEMLQINDVAFECRDQFVKILICIFELYANHITSLLIKPLYMMVSTFRSENMIVSSEFFWELVIRVFNLVPNLINDELGQSCILLAMQEYRADLIQSAKLDFISVFLRFVFNSFDEVTVEKLLFTTCQILQKEDLEIEKSKNIVVLLKTILEYKIEKKTLKPEYLSFYNQVVSRYAGN